MPESSPPDDLVAAAGPVAPLRAATAPPARRTRARTRPVAAANPVQPVVAHSLSADATPPERIPLDAAGQPLPPPATDTGPDDPEDVADDEALVDEEAAAADRALKFLHDANIAFNTPERINRDQTADVVLVLSRKESIAALKAAIDADVTGGREGAAIKTASRMEAKLTGMGFDITPATGVVQAVGTQDRVMWTWQVRPKATGPQTLTLTLTAKLDKHGVADKTLRAFTRRIEVDVTPTQRVGEFAGKNWQWLWGAILVPLAAAGRGWYTSHKRSKDPPVA
jgi:hypothetical protein